MNIGAADTASRRSACQVGLCRLHLTPTPVTGSCGWDVTAPCRKVPFPKVLAGRGTWLGVGRGLAATSRRGGCRAAAVFRSQTSTMTHSLPLPSVPAGLTRRGPCGERSQGPLPGSACSHSRSRGSHEERWLGCRVIRVVSVPCSVRFQVAPGGNASSLGKRAAREAGPRSCCFPGVNALSLPAGCQRVEQEVLRNECFTRLWPSQKVRKARDCFRNPGARVRPGAAPAGRGIASNGCFWVLSRSPVQHTLSTCPEPAPWGGRRRKPGGEPGCGWGALRPWAIARAQSSHSSKRETDTARSSEPAMFYKNVHTFKEMALRWLLGTEGGTCSEPPSTRSCTSSSSVKPT